MARIVWLRAMAGWLATAPHHGGDRTRPQIAQAQELFQQLAAIVFQTSESVGHKNLLCAYRYAQNYAPKKEKLPIASPRSSTLFLPRTGVRSKWSHSKEGNRML